MGSKGEWTLEQEEGNRLAKVKVSAGLVMFRHHESVLQVLLVHPGGPYFTGKDEGAGSIPKGEFEGGEEPLEAAIREFVEEIGVQPSPPFIDLGSVRQKGGKTVIAWAFRGDCDPEQITGNTFTMEWPPRSGRCQAFPEVDRAAFFTLGDAALRINPAQLPLLDALQRTLNKEAGSGYH